MKCADVANILRTNNLHCSTKISETRKQRVPTQVKQIKVEKQISARKPSYWNRKTIIEIKQVHEIGPNFNGAGFKQN